MFLHAKKFAELLPNDYVYILIRIGFSFALDSEAETQYNLPKGWLLKPMLEPQLISHDWRK
jgi:hypothetical protein